MKKQHSLCLGIAEVNFEVPLQIREKINFHTSEIEPIVKKLNSEETLFESIFLCTCNRSMIIFITDTFNWEEAVCTIQRLLVTLSDDQKVVGYIDLYRDESAFKKLVMLGIGADSAMFGEDQILGQIRRFYLAAQKYGSVGPILNRVIQTLIFVCRKIKLSQKFSHGTVSITGLVIKKIEEYEEHSPETKKILMVGWGDIFFTIHKILVSKDRNYEIFISNRTLDTIKVTANKFPIQEIKKEARNFDVIISMTSRLGFVVDVDTVMLENKKYLIFDLGVPRNIDPNLSKKENITLINIDDLNRISNINLFKRKEIIDTLVGNRDLIFFQEKMMNFLNNYDKMTLRNEEIQKKLLIEAKKSDFKLVKNNKKALNCLNKKIYRENAMLSSSSKDQDARFSS